MDQGIQINVNDNCMIRFPKWESEFKIPCIINKIKGDNIFITIDNRYISFIEDTKENESIKLFQEGQAESKVFDGTIKTVNLNNRTLVIMDHMNNKINMITNESLVDNTISQPTDVNISGSGIRFDTKEAFHSGEFLHLILYLPIEPSLQIEAIGQVVSCKKTASSDQNLFSTAIRFLFINETDRDEIVKYTFLKERSFLRSKEIIREER